MTPAEYRAAIARLGLSQVAAGKLLGVDGRTSQKWALGERAVPPPVVIALRYMEEHGLDTARKWAAQRVDGSP